MVSYLKRVVKRPIKILLRALTSFQHFVNLYLLIRVVRPFTMISGLRLIMLYGLAREMGSNIEGDIVECGVCNGGSAALIGAAIRDYPNCSLLLYDTFEGLPAPSPKDGLLAHKFEGECKGSTEAVLEVLRKTRFPLERVVFRKGLFKDTFNEIPTKCVVLLHIDADWYDSVLHSLRTFYPLIPDGGIIVLDDFGFWEGAREAFYDFCKEQGIKPLLERVGPWQAFWRKGCEHNRSICANYKNGIYWPQSLQNTFTYIRVIFHGSQYY